MRIVNERKHVSEISLSNLCLVFHALRRRNTLRLALRSTAKWTTWATMSPLSDPRWSYMSALMCTSPRPTSSTWPRSTWRRTACVIGSVLWPTRRTPMSSDTSESAPTMMRTTMRSKDINIHFLHMLFLNAKTNDTRCKHGFTILKLKALTYFFWLFSFLGFVI